MEQLDWSADEWGALTEPDTPPEVPQQPWGGGPAWLTPELLKDADFLAQAALLGGLSTMGWPGAVAAAGIQALSPIEPGSETLKDFNELLESLGQARDWYEYATLGAALFPYLRGKYGARMAQMAMDHVRRMVDRWGEPPKDVRRLFHGGERYIPGLPVPEEVKGWHQRGRNETVGRWATPDPGYASDYGTHSRGPLWGVDVPEHRLNELWLPNQPPHYRSASGQWANEYLLDPDSAVRMRLMMPEELGFPPELLNKTLTHEWGQRHGYPEGTRIFQTLEEQAPRGAVDRYRQSEAELLQTTRGQPSVGSDVYLEMLRNIAKEYER